MKQETLRGDRNEMAKFQLGASATLASMAIRVKDRDKMIAFYRDIIGFALKGEENALAIMGISDQKAEYLLLEESPRADQGVGQIKKMAHFSLVIPTRAEFLATIKRLRDYGTELIEVAVEPLTIACKDPEDNGIQFIYRDDALDPIYSLEQIDTLTIDVTPKLSSTVFFGPFNLNVYELAKEQDFLQTKLGFVPSQDSMIFQNDSLETMVSLTSVTDDPSEYEAHEIIGLEFIRFILTQEDLLALEAHFEEQNVPFYIDKKKSILTIYDALGVEWWFERQK